MKLSPKKIKFIENYFNENDEPRREYFNALSTSEELHYIADRHNWDGGITVLEWIAESPLCAEATALTIFWRAQPNDFLAYDYKATKIKDNDVRVFDLIRTIVKNYENGFYAKSEIAYDPNEDMPEEENVPQIAFEKSGGEEPYIYYDKKEVASWFGEYLQSQIYRCENSIDLYNIAYLLDPFGLSKTYKAIIENDKCDKGIALMIFWRIKTHYGTIENDIINKIKNGEYKELIQYDPKADAENKIGVKYKWEIPEIMKKAPQTA
jgi:hypothetical protein